MNRLLGFVPLTLLIALAACKGKKEANKELAPTASALAESKSDSKSARKWQIADGSTATFTMPGKIETIKGTVDKARGELEVDLSDLGMTRGKIGMDLLSLKTNTFDDQQKNEKQTVDAQTWLEVHERIGDAAKVAANRWAEFAIRNVRLAEPKDVSKGGPERAAKISADGELLIHGRMSKVSVDLEATFQFDGDKPKSVEIKTAKPMVVMLEAHEIRPRDKVGKFIGWAGQTVLRDKVSEESHVTLDLKASPAP
jgi:hypothetical protein